MDPNLTLRIDLASTVPAYRQIVDALRALLVQGRLKPGDTLPTVRRLAVDLAVHHNTVAEAYRQLAAEGWLDVRRRRGALVTARRRPPADPQAASQFTRRIEELVAKARADGLASEAIAGELDRLSALLRGNGSW